MKKFKKLFVDIPTPINIFNIVFILLWTLMDCGFVTIMSGVISKASHGGTDFTLSALCFIGYIAAWELLEYTGDCVVTMSQTYIENNAFFSCFKRLYTTKPEVLKKSNTGYIAGLINKNTSKKETAYQYITEMLLMGVFYDLYVIFYISKFSWIFSIIIAVCSIVAVTIRIVALKITKDKVTKLNDSEAARTKIFMDAATNISTVQKLRAKDFMSQKMTAINDECMTNTKKWIRSDEFFFCLYKFIMYMVCPLCLLVFSVMDRPSDFDSIAFLSYISITEVKLIHYVKNIATAIKNYGYWSVVQDKVDNITNQQNAAYVNSSIGDDFNTISIKDLEFNFKKDNDRTVTIKIPNFNFNKGDFVSISGESGQGKTTTLNLLSGAIENNNILVDGKILDKNLDAVYIAQDVEMFDMSLRDNLTLGADIPDEELIDLLDRVGMKDWYDSQPEGLDVILGERGVFISTGQRQRLNLLRGLLIKDKYIYLLDEPTSNVDDATEEKIVELVNEKLKDKTVIIVTHREKITEICNRRYSFKNGTVREILS